MESSEQGPANNGGGRHLGIVSSDRVTPLCSAFTSALVAQRHYFQDHLYENWHRFTKPCKVEDFKKIA